MSLNIYILISNDFKHTLAHTPFSTILYFSFSPCLIYRLFAYGFLWNCLIHNNINGKCPVLKSLIHFHFKLDELNGDGDISKMVLTMTISYVCPPVYDLLIDELRKLYSLARSKSPNRIKKSNQQKTEQQ